MRQIAPCKAREMMFTGDQISADEAVSLGLCNRVVAPEALMDETMALANKIASKSPLVLKLLKRNLRQGQEMPLGAALAHEQAMIGLVLDTADAQDRKRVVWGKSVSVRGDLGGRRSIKKKKSNNNKR